MKLPRHAAGEVGSDCVPDPRHELVERIVASPTFAKSKRLQELLLFLWEHTLAEPNAVIHEQAIGVQLYGRPSDYDTSQDTLVRTQVYQLRKKLQQYFAGEGSGESLAVDIPKGTYTPAFSERAAQVVEFPAADLRVIPEAKRSGGSLRLWLALLAVCGVAGVLWLGVHRQATAGSASLGPEYGPSVDRLWRQMFANGRPTRIAVADTGMALFSVLLGRQIDLHEYSNHDFDRIADESAASADLKAAAKRAARWVSTGTTDASLAGRIGALAAVYHFPLDVVSARDLELSSLQSQNVILFGGTASNPWVELFHNRLKYFAPGDRKAGLEGYCRVAFLPNLGGHGTILSIAATDQASIAAGGDFITTEDSIRKLRAGLKLGANDAFPYFEALLKVQVLNNGAPGFELVAQRTIEM